MTTFLIGRVGLLAGTLQYPGVAQGRGWGGGGGALDQYSGKGELLTLLRP